MLADPLTEAQAQAPAQGVLGEVVVTARKREESLQEVSAAVTAVSGDDLRAENVTDVRDIQTIVPTVSVGEVVGNMKVFIRGLGNTTNNRNEDPEVNLYVDGAVISRVDMQSLAFFDLERLEVLRGPQGTLYGRNSTGGAINLITAKPTRVLDGYGRLTVGNYELARFEGAIGGPLSDTLSGRFAYMVNSRGGYGTNITTGHDIDDDKRQAARAQVQYEPTENLSFLLSGEWAHEDDNTGLLSFLGVTFPDNQDDVRMRAPGVGGFSDPGSRDAAGNTDPFTKRETWSVTGTMNWEINDQFTLRNIANYRDSKFRSGQDLDLSSVVTSLTTTPGINTASSGQNHPADQLSEELQLLYSGELAGRRLQGILGLYYFDSTYHAETNIGLTPLTEIRASLRGQADTTAWAAFWNATYDFAEHFSLRLGGRYNDEDREIRNSTVVNPESANPLVIIPAAANDKKTFTNYTSEAGIDWKPNDNVMVYYTYAQGFRSGAALLAQSASGIANETTVDSQELGLKATWFDRTLLTNIVLFDAQIKDLQRTQALPDPGGPTGFLTLFRNIPEYESRGVEVELIASPTDAWRVSASGSYLDASFGDDYLTQDPISPNTVLNPIASVVDVSGNIPQLTSKWRYTLETGYDFQLEKGTLSVGAGAAYRSKHYFDDLNREPFVEDGYWLYNANLSFKPANGTWSIDLWSKNLADEKVIADTSFSGLGRVLSKIYVPPRTFGVSFNYAL